jgi:hypothetical protein
MRDEGHCFFCSRGSLTPVAAPNASPNDFFWDESVYPYPCFEGCGLGAKVSSVAGGADPGRGAERLSERLFGGEPDSNQRFRSHCLEGCGLGAKCENRGQRPQLQWRLCRLISGFFAGFEMDDRHSNGESVCV